MKQRHTNSKLIHQLRQKMDTMGLHSLACRYTKTQAEGRKRLSTALFSRPLIRYSEYLHGGQRQTMSDYHRLVWEMKNALINGSHTASCVRGGRKTANRCFSRPPILWRLENTIGRRRHGTKRIFNSIDTKPSQKFSS